MKNITLLFIRHWHHLLVLAVFLCVSLVFLSCDKMEDSYEQYLNNRIYSPRVTELRAKTGYKTVTLQWKNPAGNIAQKILLKYADQEQLFDEMLEEVVVTDLEIKGYEMVVYTIDGFGNRSVPASVYVFPNGESE